MYWIDIKIKTLPNANILKLPVLGPVAQLVVSLHADPGVPG